MKRITSHHIIGLATVVSGMLWSAFAAAPPVDNDPRAPGWRALSGATTAKWGFTANTANPSASPIDNFTNPNGTPTAVVKAGTGGSWSAYSASWTNQPDGNRSVSNVWYIGRGSTEVSKGWISNTIPQAVAAAPAYRLMQIQYTWLDSSPASRPPALAVAPGAVAIGTESIQTEAANSLGGTWQVIKKQWRLPDATRDKETTVFSCTALGITFYTDAVIVDTINVPVHRDVVGDSPVTVPSLADGVLILSDDCTPPGPYTTTTPVTCHTVDVTGYDNVVTFTVTVNQLGVPPVCVDDPLATTINTPKDVDAAKLLLNDTDNNVPPALPLTVVSVGGASDGGSVIMVAGVITYTPPVGLVGPFTFTYTAQNTLGLSSVGTVTVTVSPTPASQNMLPLGPPDQGSLIVKAQGIPGVLYMLERQDVINGPWTQIGTNQRANAQGRLEWTDSSLPDPMGIYRTKWVPE